ncbi:phage holin family protein [Candidatus Saccharibacteria bacterium]|nr:phage holin family protein [Candidatus Saccharibacteria bacterium]
MLRFFATLLLTVFANAIGLLVASILLDRFYLNGASFIVAALFFTLVTVILGPFITKVAFKNAPYLMGGIALVTTFIGLILTKAFTNGIRIEGLSTWAVATLIIWIFSVIANVVLPLFLFKKIISDKDVDLRQK